MNPTQLIKLKEKILDWFAYSGQDSTGYPYQDEKLNQDVEEIVEEALKQMDKLWREIQEKREHTFQISLQCARDAKDEEWLDRIDEKIKIRKGSLRWGVNEYEEIFSINDLKELKELEGTK